MLFKGKTKEFQDELVQWRRHFHQHPELSFEEFETRKTLLKFLEREHIEILPVESGNSIVGIIRGAYPGKTICLRADMDALPIVEASGAPYASENPGVMHACGHDVHMSVLMAALHMLSPLAGQMHGNVKFLFQEGEEKDPGGAVKLVANGALDGVDAFYACHTGTYLETGTIGFHPGPYQAASDSFEMKIIGKGGHGAYPHYSVDPIMAMTGVIQAFQTIVSRNVSPLESAVVSVCHIETGTASNVLPNSVYMEGTVRTLNEDVRKMVRARMDTICRDICAGYGCTCELSYHEGYPCVCNDAGMTAFAEKAAAKIVGESGVLAIPCVMGGEDTAYYLQKVPGVMSRLGAGNTAKGLTSPAHSPTFNVDEDCLMYGAEIMAQVAWDYLEENA